MIKRITFLILVLLIAAVNPENGVSQDDDRFAKAEARNAIVQLARDKDLAGYSTAIQKDPAAINFRWTQIYKAGNFSGETALHFAAKNADLPMLNFLLAKKADVQVGNASGNTPLHLAANKQVAQALIAAGANTRARGNLGMTPLHYAATAGVAKVLVENGAKINGRSVGRLSFGGPREGEPPLHRAAFYGRTEVVEFLISKGADVNAKANGHTALFWAAGKSSDTVKGLLAHGAVVNGFAKNDSPLWYAVEHRQIESVKLLLNAGAKATEVDQHGWSLLHSAAIWKCDTAMLELLIAAKVDVNLLTNKKDSALHIAAQYANLDAARVLLAHGADFQSVNADGETPLMQSRKVKEHKFYSIQTQASDEQVKHRQRKATELFNERRQQIATLIAEHVKLKGSEGK